MNSTAQPLDSIPAAVRPEYEQVLQFLKAERDQLDQDRQQLTDEQTRWHEQQRDWSQRLQTLESQLAELETQRQAVLEERDICRTLAAELMQDEARLVEWEDRLRQEERELASRRDELREREQEFSTQDEQPSTPAITRLGTAVAVSAASTQPTQTPWQISANATAESEAASQPSRPLQTLLTLGAFSLAALFLSGSLGGQEANTTLGWGTAILGALSTVDLLLRRCFSTRR